MAAFAMDKPQRRAVSRALLPGGSVAPEHRAATAQVARHLRGYLWVPCLLFVVGLGDGIAYLASESPLRWLWGATALLLLLAAGLAVYAMDKARAILVDEFGG